MFTDGFEFCGVCRGVEMSWNNITISMEQHSSSAVSSRSVTQEIPYQFLEPKMSLSFPQEPFIDSYAMSN
jgi:hypothetical protein